MTCDAAHHVGGFVGKMPWTCPSCGRTHCALCSGADDERGDLCDECWAMEEELARPDAMFRRTTSGAVYTNFKNAFRRIFLVEPMPEETESPSLEIPPLDCQLCGEPMGRFACDVCDDNDES